MTSQTGKIGGELAELVAVATSQQLITDRNIIVMVDDEVVDIDQNIAHSSKAFPTKQALASWVAVGEFEGAAIAQYILNNSTQDSIITLNQVGISRTGLDKTDIILTIDGRSVDISVKSTTGKEEWIFNGTQSSEYGILSTLVLGEYIGKGGGSTKVRRINEIANAAGMTSTQKATFDDAILDIKNLNEQRAHFNKTTNQKNNMGENVFDVNERRERNRVKMTTFSQPIHKNQTIILDILEELVANIDAQTLIPRLLEFSALERNIEFLKAGRNGVYLNTLSTTHFATARDNIWSLADRGDLTFSLERVAPTILTITINHNNTPITQMNIEHHGNNMRVMGFDMAMLVKNTQPAL